MNTPEEVLSTVEFTISGETPLTEAIFTVITLYASNMPGTVQYIQQKPIHNRPVATGA
jgi:hypothetical protein